MSGCPVSLRAASGVAVTRGPPAGGELRAARVWTPVAAGLCSLNPPPVKTHSASVCVSYAFPFLP